jgi:N6-adenosine-specific RNA methylase IME4
MTVLEAKALEADIAERGIQVPLEITEAGVVLDGRHRHRAALALGFEAVPVRVVDPPDQIEYMLLAAIQRRHLSESQRAATALKLHDYQERRARAEARKQANLRNGSVDVADLPHRGVRSREIAAELAGVSPRLIQNVIKVESHDQALFEKLVTGELTANRALQMIDRETNYASIGETPPLPPFQYELILADPPWNLGNNASASSPDQHYPTLTLEEIAGLPVPAAANAVLYLWAVNSHLREALEVMAAWGFEYRSNEVWVKQSIGRGKWTRHQHELLLIGRKGRARPAPQGLLLSSVITAERRAHSQKPDLVYERLEHLYPRRSKLELFARGKTRHGWTGWGNEVTP